MEGSTPTTATTATSATSATTATTATNGPGGSPLDHTRFQLRIQLLEKENAARPSPAPPTRPASGLEREKLFSKVGAPTHWEWSQIDH